jgi:hypothetical protein
LIDTGKKLTAEQAEHVRENIKRPVLYMSGGHRIGGDETPQQMVHRFALANGLPDFPGYYGADLRNGTIYKMADGE